MAIYNYDKANDDGYRRTLEVRQSNLGDRLVFDTAPRGSEPAAVLPREDVRQLRDALTEWLTPGESVLNADAVRRIVRDELANGKDD